MSPDEQEARHGSWTYHLSAGYYDRLTDAQRREIEIIYDCNLVRQDAHVMQIPREPDRLGKFGGRKIRSQKSRKRK